MVKYWIVQSIYRKASEKTFDKEWLCSLSPVENMKHIRTTAPYIVVLWHRPWAANSELPEFGVLELPE